LVRRSCKWFDGLDESSCLTCELAWITAILPVTVARPAENDRYPTRAPDATECGHMGADAWVTLAVLTGVLGLLVTDRLPPAQVVLAGTVTLFLFGVVDAGGAFAGFANPAPITIAALYVLAGAVQRTGALEWLTTRNLPSGITSDGRTRPGRRELARFLPAVLVPSGFLNNTTIVAMLAPRVVLWGRRVGRSPSGFLIPLSYASILGGLLTAIGTSTNLIVSGLLVADDRAPLGMFEITRAGLPVAVAGLVVLVVAGPRLLPRRADLESTSNPGREFTVEMLVNHRGAVVGSTVQDAGLRNLEGVYLVEIERDGQVIAPVTPTERLQSGDRLVFAGNVERIVDLQSMPGLLPAEEHHFEAVGDPGSRRFHEMVVSATSDLVGATLKQADFRNRYGAAVVAIHRAGHRLPGKLGTIPLHAGDVLLVLADTGIGRRFRDHHDFLVVSELAGEGPVRREKARLVEVTILALLVCVGVGWIDILRGALLAAAAVIVGGAVSSVQARRAVDVDVLVMIAASFGLGSAVARSGLAGEVAAGITNLAGRYGEIGLVVGVLLATMVLTEVVTNNAAAVLMYPVAVATATAAGFDPRPFAIAVAVGASASFLTPIGYQTNTMVYGMGGYRFTDFTRAGALLSLVVLAVTPPVVLAFW